MSVGSVLAANAITATLLGLGVALVARRIRQPVLLHALWLAVLLDLLAPPVVPLNLLPENWITAESSRPLSVAAVAQGPPLVVAPGARGPGWLALIALVWGVGSLVVLALAIGRGIRLSRALGPHSCGSPGLEAAVARLSGRIGISRAPRLRVVPARISPLVRPRFWGVEILIPRDLVPRLDAREIDTLLAHELAHVRRRDPWVRLVELGATVAFWWHPLVYVARAALRRAEEACCDDQVLRALPGHAVDYARALVKTLEFLCPARGEAPVWVTGAAHAPSIERRLTMILDHGPRKPLSRTARLALTVAILAALAAFPAAGVSGEPREDTSEEEERVADERELARIELERALEAEHARSARAGQMDEKAAQLARERDLARIELERALAETERARSARAGQMDERAAQLARERDLARIEIERALAEAERMGEETARDARVRDLARIELERTLVEEERAGRGVERTDDLERRNEELRREVSDLARRVRELERRLAETAPTD